MSNIILIPHYWASDLNASFALARKLCHRGHHAHYLCIPESEERIRAQGFEFTPLFSRVFPKGSIEEQFANEAQGKYGGLTAFREKFRGMCELLRNGEMDSATRDLNPALILASSYMPWVAIAAQKTGVPVLSFSSTLISVPDAMVPPFGTGLIPANTLSSRLRVYFAWKKIFVARRLAQLSVTSSGFKELARHFGYPLSEIDFKVETWPRLSLPELVLCPQDFDFPRTRALKNTYFVEASIDAERRDCDFPWHLLSDEKPLVYCTVGTLATFKYPRQSSHIFQMFMDALAEHPAWQGVVTIGHYMKADDFRCPANVLIVHEAPQLELLKRASLMVAHGGIGGVKEAIFMGVPMVLIPLAYDEPGNAARVVYHGLGLREQFENLSALTLRCMMETVLEDSAYSARAKLMSGKFVELEKRAPAIDIIERMIADRSLEGSPS
jgi:MGT family glycosyltransferase